MSELKSYDITVRVGRDGVCVACSAHEDENGYAEIDSAWDAVTTDDDADTYVDYRITLRAPEPTPRPRPVLEVIAAAPADPPAEIPSVTAAPAV